MADSAKLIAKYGIDAYVFGRIPGFSTCLQCGLGFKAKTTKGGIQIVRCDDCRNPADTSEFERYRSYNEGY